MGIVVDLTVVAVVVLSAVVGVITGFVWQATSTAGLVLGAAAGLLSAWGAGGWVGTMLSLRPPGGQLIAFFFLFGVVSVGSRIAAGVLKPRIEKWQLQRHNRFWGGVAGAVKGLLLAMIVVSILAPTRSIGRAVSRSYLAANLASLGAFALPDSLRGSSSESRKESPEAPAQSPESQGSR